MKDMEIFPGKSFQDLMEDIYNNTVGKQKFIREQITSLMKLIGTPEDAAVLAPSVKDFMEVYVKNDEHLIKMAQVVQRLASAEVQAGITENDMLSDEEKEKLLGDAVREMNLTIEKTDEALRAATDDLKKKE